MKRFVGILGILMVLGVGVAGSALANGVAVYNPLGGSVGNYGTIQAGVDACPAGGKVSVAAGTYNDAVFVGKSIELVGVGMPTNVNVVPFDGTDTAIIFIDRLWMKGYNDNIG